MKQGPVCLTLLNGPVIRVSKFHSFLFLLQISRRFLVVLGLYLRAGRC